MFDFNDTDYDIIGPIEINNTRGIGFLLSYFSGYNECMIFYISRTTYSHYLIK